MSHLKYVTLTDALAAYIDAHRFDAGDPLLDELHRVTKEKTGSSSGMQIAGEQGPLLSILVAATGAKTCVEIGTFTGYSGICTARALPAGGTLHCFDVSEEFTAIAREFWRKAGLADRIELTLGPANETLPKHCPPQVDFAFIDADKPGYDGYYEFLLPRMRPSGLILFDNMLWDGAVVDGTKRPGESLEAIRALNDKLVADDRVDAMLLSVADGILMARKR